MKRIAMLLLNFIFCLTCLTACAAESDDSFILTLQIGNPNMTINGIEKPIDENGTAPILSEEGRTLLPVRAVVEEMGGAMAWDSETQTVLLGYKENVIVLEIDNHTAYLNESSHELDVAPVIINDRTMLPIRFIAEGLEFDVEWDGDTQTVTITPKNEEV